MELLSKIKVRRNALVPIRTVIPEWVGPFNRTSKLVRWRHVVNLVDWMLYRIGSWYNLIYSIDVNLVSNVTALSESNAMCGTRAYCDKRTRNKQKPENRHGRLPHALPNVMRAAARY